MRTLVLVLFFVVFNLKADSNLDFSMDGVKSWFSEVYQKASSGVDTGINKLKSSFVIKKVGDFLDQTEDTLRENRSGTVTPEFLEARKNFADCASKLNKELSEDIRSLSQLKDAQFHNRVVKYKGGKQYVTALEECLAKELDNFIDAKTMKDEARYQMNNILDILTDELIYSYISDLREAYNAFNDAFDKLENQLKSEK